jgi:hypothetical protein
MAAISFPSIYKTGGTLHAQSPITIEAQRLVSFGEEPCRVLGDAEPRLYFSTVNTSGGTLSVPLSYSRINSIVSATGQAVPTERFVSGTNGFSIPEAYFQQDDELVGSWNFMGQEIIVPSSPPMCAAAGISGGCTPVDSAALRGPIGFTRETITKLVNRSLDAARAGRWNESDGDFRVPFLRRGAAVLSSMEKALPNSTQKTYSCSVVPSSCQQVRISKIRIMKAFLKLFDPHLPPRLRPIVSHPEQRIRKFRRALRKMPGSYTTCS